MSNSDNLALRQYGLLFPISVISIGWFNPDRGHFGSKRLGATVVQGVDLCPVVWT